MNFANLMQGMGPNLLDAVGQGVLWGIIGLCRRKETAALKIKTAVS